MIRALLPLMLLAAPALAQRAELPVREVVLAGGVRRYVVTLTVDGQPVEAGLDTGSTGLRLLARALPGEAAQGGEHVRYGYGSGVSFEGTAVRASVGFGGRPAVAVRVMRIDTVGCLRRRPDCPAARTPADAYRIMSDGQDGQGFVAILGIGLHDDSVANPLVQLGVRRWIVELPRAPGETGRLLLEPSDAEVARYRNFAVLPGTNMVAGCIAAAAPGGAKVCAPAMLDTGASGLRVQGGKDGDVLSAGTPALVSFGDASGTASMGVTIGRRDQAAGMRLYPARADGKLSLSFGIAPYLHWSVLYDARARRIGVSDR